MATAPFSESEAAFLEQLLVEYGLGSVLFVVTAIDRLRRPGDRERIVSTVTERIQERIRRHAHARFGQGSAACEDYLRRVGEPRVFGVSGYDALVGKTDGDEALLAESRFPEFEEFLERFLTEESGLVALKTHAERLNWFATALRRNAATRLESVTQSPGPIVNDSLEAFLRSLEWLAHDARNRLEERRRQAQSEMRSLLQPFSQDLLQAAGTCLANVTLTAEDVEPPRSTLCVKSWCGKLTGAANEASAAKVPVLLSQLRARVTPAVADLLCFATAFDRVLSHVADPSMSDTARSKAVATTGSGSTGTPPPAHESLSATLQSTSGFDRARATEGAVAVLFDAHVDRQQAAIGEALALTPFWADGIDVQPMQATGPKFTRKALDLIRIEKFKMDIRGRLIAALTQYLQATATAREQSLDRQIDDAFAALARPIERALEDIRAQRAQLSVDHQRRVAVHEHERRRLQELDSEIARIQERAKEAASQLDAIQFRVLARTDSDAGL